MDETNVQVQVSEEFEDEESQKSRAFLREKFLRLVAKISNGQECIFNMHENITVQAKLKACDLDFQNVAVESLQTPYLPVEHAIIRSSDIISIQFVNLPIESLNN